MSATTGIFPFWLWNGRMEEAELTRQLELAREGGVTGMTIHARLGNRVPYLSDRWMELMRHTCTEARRLGLEIWLYDEEGFPSGDAGGRIPAQGEAYRQKVLVFADVNAAETRQMDGVIRVFSKHAPERVVRAEELTDGERVLVFRRVVNNRFPDILYPGTVREFLKLTHERYWTALREFFDGKVVTGVFTDDNHYLFGHGPLLAYMDDLEESFYARYGYRILDRLSCLVENLPDSPKVRLDYHRHLAECFNERFMRPIHEWCHTHRITLYGHLSGDEGPLYKMVRNFADPGAYLMFFEVPGMDDFLLMNVQCTQMRDSLSLLPASGKLNRADGFSVIGCCKQASSVATQLGDGRCMSETLASGGWGVPLEVLIANLHFLNILGVNIFVTHDYAYTTEKAAKRDHPASYFFQQPYFRRNREIFGSVARSLEWAGRGRVQADTLVIHPVTTAQIALDGEEIADPGCYRCEVKSTFPDSARLTDRLAALNLHLLRSHISFEYGFESVIEKSGSVEGKFFRIGHGKYSTVILPDMVSVSGKLRSLLESFAANGGKVIYIGGIPSLVDGIPCGSGSLPAGTVLSAPEEITTAQIAPDLMLSTREEEVEKEIALGVRRVDGHLEYLAANYGPRSCTVRFGLADYLCYDPVSDAVFPLPEQLRLERFRMVHLAPSGTVGIRGRMPADFRPSAHGKLRILSGNWQIRRTMPNVLRWDDAVTPYSRPVPFHDSEFDGSPEFVSFHNEFDLKFKPETLQMAFEPVTVSMLKVNGTDVLGRPGAPHPAAPDLRVVEIGDLVRVGRNAFGFNRKDKYPEFFYLLGEFSVLDAGEIPVLGKAEELTFGNLAVRGLPYYWGTLEYALETDLTQWAGKSCRIEIPPPLNGAVGLRINGTDLPVLPCAPWHYEVTEHLRKRKNLIELTYYGTAQNFFGPRRRTQQQAHFTAWFPKQEGIFFYMDLGLPGEPGIRVEE